MKLDEREIADLHELAHYSAKEQGRLHTRRLINVVYGLHVWFLVKVIQWLQPANK